MGIGKEVSVPLQRLLGFENVRGVTRCHTNLYCKLADSHLFRAIGAALQVISGRHLSAGTPTQSGDSITFTVNVAPSPQSRPAELATAEGSSDDVGFFHFVTSSSTS